MRIVLTVTCVAIRRRHDFRDVPGDVAGVAIETAVRADQRVAGLGVVIEAPPLPAVRVVADRTIRTQAALVMPIPVALDAVRRRILEGRRAMAFFARHDRMTSNERETRKIMIEGSRPAPTGLAVAALAVGAKLSFVPVVLPVTGNARCRELIAIEIAGVTGIALDLCMPASQRIFRVLVVVEANGTPLAFVVATFTLDAVTSGVDVLDLVTADACRTNPFVTLPGMAGGADYRTV